MYTALPLEMINHHRMPICQCEARMEQPFRPHHVNKLVMKQIKKTATESHTLHVSEAKIYEQLG